jgi:hypothetical protein
MTHEQKALDLIYSFYYALPNNGSTQGIDSTTRRYQEAIRCALIAVDEIINLCASGLSETKYWNAVKLEIQKIDDSKTTN